MSNLLSNRLENAKIVEKKKIIFLIPVIVVVLAIIMGAIYYFANGSVFNLGMDFAGGYTINVNVGANLTEENTEEYKVKITEIVENYTDAEGEDYGIKISQILVSGTGDDTSLQVKFKSVTDDDTMEILIDGIIDAILEEITYVRPTIVSRNGSSVTLSYDIALNTSVQNDITSRISSISSGTIGASNFNVQNKSVTFDLNNSSLTDEEIISIAALDDKYVASAYTNGKVGATVSQDLLYNALTAIIIALVAMLIYIAVCFEFTSGLSAIVALMNDLIIMFAFMIIFHIEFNSTFIAALITILGYSINNSIILFDRIRSNIKATPNINKNELANTSIVQSVGRCLNTTVTTLIMITSVCVVCAIASIFNEDLYQMVVFSLPIIVGLISGFFSAMFIAPSVWVALGGKKGSPILGKKKVAKEENK